jgi:hypothetical protein
MNNMWLQHCNFLGEHELFPFQELDADQAGGITVGRPGGLYFPDPPDAVDTSTRFPFTADAETKRGCYIFYHRVKLSPGDILHAEPLLPANDYFYSTVNHPLNVLTPCAWMPAIPYANCAFFFTPFHQFLHPTSHETVHVRTGSVVKRRGSDDQWLVISTWIRLSSTRTAAEVNKLRGLSQEDDEEIKKAAQTSLEKMEEWSKTVDQQHLPRTPCGIVSAIKVEGTTLAQLREEVKKPDLEVESFAVEEVDSTVSYTIEPDQWEEPDKVSFDLKHTMRLHGCFS